MKPTFRYAIHRAGKSFGVESVSKLHDLACRRKLGPEDFVFDYTRRQWVRAEAIVELQPIFAAHNEIDSIDFKKLPRSAPRADLSAPELTGSQMREFIGMTVPRKAGEAPKTVAPNVTPPPEVPNQALAATPPPLAIRGAQSPSMTRNTLDINRLFDDLDSEATFNNGSGYRVMHGRTEMRQGMTEQQRDEILKQLAPENQARLLYSKATADDVRQAGRTRDQKSRKRLFLAAATVLLVGLIALGAFWAGIRLNSDVPAVYMTQFKDTDSLPVRTVSP